MANLLELREFQWASVKSVCEGLERHPIYALADEVGLGKTLICAEVLNQLVAGHSNSAPNFVYYVAPSIELLHQNLRSIRRYLEERCGDRFHIWTSISRLSQIPRDFAEHRKRSGPEIGRKGVIHLIGLSPNTSFNLRGAGQLSERIFLAALFGFRRHPKGKADIARFFWCLNRTLDPGVEKKYLRQIETYASKEYLGQLLKFRKTEHFKRLISEIVQANAWSASEIRLKVGEIRHYIVDFLISSTSPRFIIFDEWHKYKKTCFTNKLLRCLLAHARTSSRTKVLLVSATPFSVEFKDGNQGEAQFERGGDLEGLLQMIWGQERYLSHYERLMDEQNSYVEALAHHLKTPYGYDEALESCRLTYQNHLRNYCTRTERPRVEMQANQHSEDAREGSWKSIAKSNSLHNFLKKFNRNEHALSPILPMWSDGHSFPAHGYPGLAGYGARALPGLHWKVERLIERLKVDFQFKERLHSFRHPPLWLQPEAKLRNRKHIIFSEFLFVPEEICRQLNSSVVGFGTVAKRKWAGSVLGYFPIKTHRGIRSGHSAADAIHFLLFYPFLVFERGDENRISCIEKKRQEIEEIISTAASALAMVKKLEELFCDQEFDRRRLVYRWGSLDFLDPIPASPRFREYARFLFFSGSGDWSLGSAIARTCGVLWREHCASAKTGEGAIASKDFEQATMRLSAAILRLFASPEAQTLKVRGGIRLPRAISHRWNSHLKFALWYSRKFNLEGTLREFAKLLSAAGVGPSGVVVEITAAIALRKGASGNRFVRSFHDRKISAGDNDGDADETVSLKSLRAAFNSPFPPYVLASTSVGQEGLDFHRYCASVIHWNPPSSPSVLRQREGRVDRFQSLQIRRELQDTGDKIEMTYQGMSPDFVLMQGDRRINHVDREVWYLPFTAQEASWRTCLQRMYYNDLLIGAPDPLSDERLLLSAIGEIGFDARVARFQSLRIYAISLRPRTLMLNEIEMMRSRGKSIARGNRWKCKE